MMSDPELTDYEETDEIEPIAFEDEHPDPPVEEDEPEPEPEDRASQAPDVVEHPEGGRIETHLAIADLVVDYRHWVNPRTFTGLDDESLQALRADIASKTIASAPGDDGEVDHLIAGIDEPLRIVRIAAQDGVVNLVIDGQRRYRAAELTGFGDALMIPVYYREPEPVEWTEALARKYLQEVLTVVGLRAGLSAYELSEAAMRLHDAKPEGEAVPEETVQ